MWNKNTRYDIQDMFDSLVTPEPGDPGEGFSVHMAPETRTSYMRDYMRQYRAQNGAYRATERQRLKALRVRERAGDAGVVDSARQVG